MEATIFAGSMGEPTDDVESTTEQPITEESQPDPIPEIPEQSIDVLKKKYTDAQTFIGRQGNTIGALNNQLAQVSERIRQLESIQQQKPEEKEPAVTDSDFLDKPVETVDKIVEEKIRMAEEEKHRRIYAAQTAVENTKKAVLSSVPEFPELLQDMGRILVEDGLSAEQAMQFINQPFVANPGFTIMLAQRAKVLKENRDLRQQLGMDSNSKPKAAAAVQQSSFSRPLVTGGGQHTGSKKRVVTREEMSRMSDKDLDEYIKNLRT